MPGDRLRLRNGRVFIDGKLLSESYTVYRDMGPDQYRDNFPRMQEANPSVNSDWWIRMRSLVRDGELTIPPGCYFVMGDNRNDSDDSRYWGLVPRDAIVGEPLVIYFSLKEKSRDQAEPPTSPGVIDFARWDRLFHVIK
jgi:signal peptidase I